MQEVQQHLNLVFFYKVNVFSYTGILYGHCLSH